MVVHSSMAVWTHPAALYSVMPKISNWGVSVSAIRVIHSGGFWRAASLESLLFVYSRELSTRGDSRLQYSKRIPQR